MDWIQNTFSPEIWASAPFHLWTVVLFIFGTMVGSFLNVCIHRMPLDQSVVSPPSHCPECRYSIPWYLNLPIVTWIFLNGKCANCGCRISPRYLGVEALTGFLFMGVWLVHGSNSAGAALVLCLLMAGFVVATFIDLKHYIIPDEITIGGMVAGTILSFLVPALHASESHLESLERSFWGMLAGAGSIYLMLTLGKIFFGKKQFELQPDTKIVFGESGFDIFEQPNTDQDQDQDQSVSDGDLENQQSDADFKSGSESESAPAPTRDPNPRPSEHVEYGELFYRPSDAAVLHAKSVVFGERRYENVSFRLSQTRLLIGDDVFDPEKVTEPIEVITDAITLPREAMGFGDVKFMGAIGAFMGWQAVLFTLLVSSFVGAFIGVTLIAMKKREASQAIPYGPYLALAAALWVFGGKFWSQTWFFSPLAFPY